MLETILAVAVTGVVGLVAFLIIYARWNYGTLERLGIPVAKPHFILGSDPDGHKIISQEKDVERYKKYGPVFGVYEGRIPRVFVLDPDMLRRILVKDFDYFFDRSVPDWGDEIWSNLLDFLPGEKWKTVRSGLTPMFTSSRIRNGGKQFEELVSKYILELKKDFTGNSMKFDMKNFMTPVFVEFTSDYFLSIKLSGEGNIREHFIYKMILGAMGEDFEPNFMLTLIGVYPFILKLFPVFPKDGIAKFRATLDHVITTRKAANKDTSSGKDFVDVMVSMFDALDSPEYKRLKIDRVTLEAQAFEMFIAGFDSILGTLQILSYYMATCPEVQNRLLEEVDGNPNGKDGSIADLPYMTACIKEAVRLNPSFHHLERLCMKDWTYNEGKINITIPKGTSVIIPAWATNRNPDVFKDPEEFHPERFLKGESNEVTGNSQYANNSFGHGPRNCVGMRMGIEMVKAGLARVLREFKFEARDDTKAELVSGIPVLTRYKPISVTILKREEEE